MPMLNLNLFGEKPEPVCSACKRDMNASYRTNSDSKPQTTPRVRNPNRIASFIKKLYHKNIKRIAYVFAGLITLSLIAVKFPAIAETFGALAFPVIVGVIGIGLIVLGGWMVGAGFHKIGWYLGKKCGIWVEPFSLNKHVYLPWLLGAAVFVMPWITYHFGNMLLALLH